jgi:outer membrane protein assembly factor BamB
MDSSHMRDVRRWCQLRLLISVLLGTLLLSACTAATAGTAATGGTLRWRFQTDGGTIDGVPTVANDLVYVGVQDGPYAGSVYALEASTGAVRWRVHDSMHAYSAPAVADGVLYVGSTEGSVAALDARTGTVRWRFQTDGPVGSLPAVANGVVYAAFNDGSVYALNAKTGAQRWRFQTDGAQGMAPSPVVANGAVYVSSSQFLYALNA